MTEEEFLNIVNEINNGKHYGLMPQPIDGQDGLNILIKHFLGDDWYSVNPISTQQVNTEAICSILRNTQKKKFKMF